MSGSTASQPERAKDAADGSAAPPAETAFPLHCAIWDDDAEALRAALDDGADMEAIDPRGNTPLLLAMRLERVALVVALLRAGADTFARGSEGFAAFQEALQLPGRAGVDAHVETLRALLAQTWRRTEAKVGELLVELESIPDCDLVLDWTFASWMPLISRVLPSDTVRIRKRGSSVRVDSSLRSFSSKSLEWVRGDVSALLVGNAHPSERRGQMHMLDHAEKTEGSLRERFNAPPAASLAAATLQARQVDFVVQSKPLLLGAQTRAKLERSGQHASAAVGPWRDCALYEMTGAKLATVTKRNSRQPSLRRDCAPVGRDGDGEGGPGGEAAADEIAAAAARLLSAESRMRPVKDAVRSLLSTADPLSAGRTLVDEDLLNDALTARVEVAALSTCDVAVRLPEGGPWLVRYHFLSEGGEIAYRLALRPQLPAGHAAELDLVVARVPASEGAPAQRSGSSSSADGAADAAPVGAPRAADADDDDAATGEGAAAAALELFWTPPQLAAPDDDEEDDEAAAAANGAAVELKPLERASAHASAVRGEVGPFAEGVRGEVVLSFVNEAWLRARPVRYRLRLARPPSHIAAASPPSCARAPSASAPPPLLARATTRSSADEAAASGGASGSGSGGSGGSGSGSNGDDVPLDPMPFEDYFHLPDGAAPARAHAPGRFRRIPSSASETQLGAISLAMASDFPLTLAQMLPLARTLAVSSRQHESLAAFFERKLPPGFPVQFTLVVFPTVTATVTFGAARVFARGADGEAAADAPSASLFEIPPDYARGKYRDLSDRVLDS